MIRPLEAASIHATSWGAGLRLGGAGPGTLSSGSLSLEYGHATSSDGTAGDRVTLVSAFKF